MKKIRRAVTALASGSGNARLGGEQVSKRDGGDTPSAGRRTTSEVLQEILSVAPATRSGIRFSVGLNHSQAKRYLPYLISEGYLQESTKDGGPAIYEISTKGQKLLTVLNEISEMVGP